MKAHMCYLSYVLRHKWFVFAECCRLGVPLLGILHDLSKFLPDEWCPYVRYFYGPRPPAPPPGTGNFQAGNSGDAAFDRAWLLHQRRNPHHWQAWVLREDDGGTKIMPMPDCYRREMLADWRGAGRAQGKPDTLAWYLANRERMLLHPDTRAWIERTLGASE